MATALVTVSLIYYQKARVATAEIQQANTDNTQPTIDGQQPTITNQYSTTNNQQPIVNNQQVENVTTQQSYQKTEKYHHCQQFTKDG